MLDPEPLQKHIIEGNSTIATSPALSQKATAVNYPGQGNYFRML